jgi:hypothetical protein
MADRQKLANALMQPPQEQAPGLMGAAPDWRQKIGNALMGATDYAGRGLALADLYSGGMLSSVAGLNPFGSYSNVMEARDRALEAVPREAKAAATEPFNPLMAMAMVPAATKKGIRAFHGSPHDFDKFSLDHIGKGEGAQAYGHGLYFAESEGVAKSYRDALRWQGSDWNDPNYVARFWLDHHKGDAAKAAAYLDTAAKGQSTPQSKAAVERAAEILRDGGQGLSAANPGRMYEVNINASPEDFLDWDKQHNEQSKFVTEALAKAKAAGKFPNAPRRYIPRTPEETSALREAGIPGIKYLDQNSRTAGEGSRNYVLFRDDIIDIVRKYGMAAAVSMYGADAVMQATGGEQQQ